MDNVKFSCVVAPSNSAVPLGCEIWLDNYCVFDQEHVSEPVPISYEFSDDDSEHTLSIRLKNKLPEHTQIDDRGNIVSDAMISITEIAFDEIDCTQVVQDLAVYRHNLNGAGPEILDQFFEDMGCNGTVEFKFNTPIYLFLLENM